MTADDLQDNLEMGKMDMEGAIEHLQRELAKIRTGKASPAMLDGIHVDYYGTSTPLKQVGNVIASDSRTLSIQVWEKSMISVVEQAIIAANLGLNPQNNGESIIVPIPLLTEERRKHLVKQAKGLGEDAKVSLRSARHKMMDAIKKAVKDGYPEDIGKRREDEVQKTTNAFTDQINKLIEAKEKDILTI
jgi:ribosome recycling factor